MRGFSLIEAVVYIGLLSLLLTGSVMSAYSIAASAAAYHADASIERDGRFILRSIRTTLENGEVAPGEEDIQRLTPYAVSAMTVAVTPASGDDPERTDLSFALSASAQDPSRSRVFHMTHYPIAQ